MPSADHHVFLLTVCGLKAQQQQNYLAEDEVRFPPSAGAAVAELYLQMVRRKLIYLVIMNFVDYRRNAIR